MYIYKYIIYIIESQFGLNLTTEGGYILQAIYTYMEGVKLEESFKR